MADLSTLRDIHLPPDAPWWPPAVGWWLLAIATVLLVVGLPGLKNAARRIAERQRVLSQFRQIRRRVSGTSDDAVVTHSIADLSKLVRQVAHRRLQPAYRTTLTGDSWLQFLTDTGDGTNFNEQPGCYLSQLPYQHQTELDKAALVGLMSVVRDWLKRHA